MNILSIKLTGKILFHKKFKTFSIFLVLVFQSAYTQIVTLVDSVTNHPLEFATITSENPGISTITNSKGQADLAQFKESDQITIRLLGYKSKIISYREAEQNDFIIKLKINGITLEEIVVSAIRWDQSGNEIAPKIKVISGTSVNLSNPQTAADLLSADGDIFIQKSQLGGGSPMIRGFSTNRVLIAVDGIRMNTAIFRSGNLQNVISIDPFEIERTEILFGPGSVIYGSDAIGGVMSFHTISPEFSYGEDALVSGKALARYSSANNEKTIHMDYRVGWKKWAMATGFTFSGFDDLRMGSDGPDDYLKKFTVKRADSSDMVLENEDPLLQSPSGYQQINLLHKIRFKPGTKLDFNYGFCYSTTTDYSRYDRLIRTKNGIPRSAEWYYGPQKWAMNNLTAEYDINNALSDQIVLRTAWQYFEESRIDRDFNDSERRFRFEKVNAYSVNLDLNKRINAFNTVYYGLEGVYNDVSSSGTDEDILSGTKIPGPSRYPQSTWESYAAYVTWHSKINDNLHLQAGLRYNQFIINAIFDTTFYPFPFTNTNVNSGAITGSAGIVYNLSEKWKISAALSSGFRSPNIDDMGKVFDSEPGSVVMPNPDLKAEYAWNAEAGIIRVFGDYLKIDLTAYYTLLDNALVRRDFIFNGLDSILYNGEMSRVQAIQNAANAYIYGIQAGTEVNLPYGWEFKGSVNYQKGEEELDDGTASPLRHAAPLFGSSHLIWSNQKLKIDGYIVYNGEISYKKLAEEERGKDYLYAKDKNRNPYSPSWYTINLKTIYGISDSLRISGGVENITDQRYRPYSSGICGPGRNVILSLQVIF